MLGLGIGEIVVIAAVLLIVVGPDNLPAVIRYLGRLYGQVRRASDDMRRAFTLEADRQDASERFEKLQERRAKAALARKQALEDVGGAGVAAPDPNLPLRPPDEPPADDAPVDDAPAEAAPADVAPVDHAPLEQPAKDPIGAEVDS